MLGEGSKFRGHESSGSRGIATFSEVFCLAMRITFNRLPNELSERFEFRLSFY